MWCSKGIVCVLSVLWGCNVSAFLHASMKPIVRKTITSSAVTSISEEDLTKCFGRLADKLLLLDVPGAGTVEMMNCCHGGCDNCDFTRVFDEMRAGRPKWVAHYVYQEHIDGRNHAPSWVEAIFGNGVNEGAAALSEDEFVSALQAVPYQACLGPMKSVDANEPPSEASCRDFFAALTEASASATLTAEGMATALTALTGEEHGCMWRDFKAAFV